MRLPTGRVKPQRPRRVAAASVDCRVRSALSQALAAALAALSPKCWQRSAIVVVTDIRATAAEEVKRSRTGLSLPVDKRDTAAP